MHWIFFVAIQTVHIFNICKCLSKQSIKVSTKVLIAEHLFLILCWLCTCVVSTIRFYLHFFLFFICLLLGILFYFIFFFAFLLFVTPFIRFFRLCFGQYFSYFCFYVFVVPVLAPSTHCTLSPINNGWMQDIPHFHCFRHGSVHSWHSCKRNVLLFAFAVYLHAYVYVYKW